MVVADIEKVDLFAFDECMQFVGSSIDQRHGVHTITL